MYNTSGSGNTALGYQALQTNTTGSNNTAIGAGADAGSNNLTNATAIGYNAVAGQNNTLVLGGTGANAVNVGIGTSTPAYTLQVIGATSTTNFQMTSGADSGYILQSDGNGNGTWINDSALTVGKAWGLHGNQGTVPDTNFIGTTDSEALAIFTNNAEKVRIGSQPSGVTSFGMNLPVNHQQNAIDPNAELEINCNGSTNDDLDVYYIDNDDFSSYIVSSKARGTYAAPAIVANGDQLLALQGWGYDGGAYRNAASINFNMDSVPSASSMPSNITFSTTPVGQATSIGFRSAKYERMRIDRNGNVGIGTNSPVQTLTMKNTTGLYTNNELQSGGLGILTGTNSSGNQGSQDYALYMGADKTNDVSYIQSVKYGIVEAALALNARGGNVGIGTASPAYLLDVNGQGRFTATGETSNSALILSSPTDVSLAFDVSANTGNEKYWSFHAKNTTFFGSAEDSTGVTTDWLQVSRGPNDSIDLVTFPNSPVLIGPNNIFTPPLATLTVNGFQQLNLNSYGYVNSSGGTGTSSGTNPYSIFATQRIAAVEFDAFSDARIKSIVGLTDNAADLKTLMNLRITNYHFVDTVEKGNKLYKKVIAQEVEKVYPNAVSQMTNVVPDIYKMADMQNGRISLANNLKAGDHVKLILKDKSEMFEVMAADNAGFNVKGGGDGKVFVYGREVKDFRSVDYEALTTLNISATQELLKMINDLQQQNQALNRKNNEMENKLAAVSNDIETIKMALQLANQTQK